MEVVAIAAVVGLVALLRSKLQRTGGPDLGWSGQVNSGAPAPSAALVPGDARSVVRALARVESRLLLGSFSFAVGGAFCVLVILMFPIAWGEDIDGTWETVWIDAPILVYPLVGMALLGAHSAVTRERRDGASELFSSCPTSPVTRTRAHLRTAWVSMLGVVGFLGLFGLAAAWRGSAFGPLPAGSVGDMLAAVVLALGGTWLGVALGRWTPWWPAPVVALVAIMAVSTAISGIGEPGYWSQARQLSTFPRYPDYDPVFAVRPVWWHLAWLLALCSAVALVAVARHRRGRSIAFGGVAVVAALIVTGVATSRPLDADEAQRVASMVAHPERHQRCLDGPRASVCTYAGFDDLARLVAEELAPVLAALPAGAPDRLVIRQEFAHSFSELDPEVRAVLPVSPTLSADVRLGFRSNPSAITAARIATGLWAVGLPAKIDPATSMESIAGEAPAVIALWIAARGLAPADALGLASAHPAEHSDGSIDPLAAGMPWPDPCNAGASPVVWAPQDLEAARLLLALPEEQVRGVLDAEWATLTKRSTSTAQLLARFDLPTVGPIDDLGVGSWECSY